MAIQEGGSQQQNTVEHENTALASTPKADRLTIESKSQIMKRVPPFMKGIAEIQIDEEKKGQPAISLPEIESDSTSEHADDASTLDDIPSIEDELGADAIEDILASMPQIDGLTVKADDGSDVSFSRFEKRYTDGSMRTKTKEDFVAGLNDKLKIPEAVVQLDPVKSFVPYIAYAAVACGAALIWFVVALSTSDGSIMTNEPAFNAGIVILVLGLVIGIAFAGLLSYKGTEEWDGAFRLDIALTILGKMTIAMAVFVIAWSVLMGIAA